jgi:hypothetical protein
MGPDGWHVHCFTFCQKAEGHTMVEFVRDVIIAVAVLATLVAVAVHAGADPEPKRHGSAIGTAVAPNVAQTVVAPAAQTPGMAVSA